MEGLAELYLQRAENEIVVSQILFRVSGDPWMQEQFKLEESLTFYSSVISHSYYCIFYSAKAALINEGIKTSAPEVHRKTLDAFERNLVETGQLDVQLLKIYRKIVLRSEELLGIFSSEKEKRGRFTYQKLPQANIIPAKESLGNASLFFRTINKVLRGEPD